MSKKIFEPKGPKIDASKVGKGKPLHSISHPVKKKEVKIVKKKPSKASEGKRIAAIKGKQKKEPIIFFEEAHPALKDPRDYFDLEAPENKVIKRFIKQLVANGISSHFFGTDKKSVPKKKVARASKKPSIDHEGILNEIHRVAEEKGYLVLSAFKTWVFFIKKVKVSINRELNQEGFQPYQNKEDKEIWAASVIEWEDSLSSKDDKLYKVEWIKRMHVARVPFYHVRTVEGVKYAMEKY